MKDAASKSCGLPDGFAWAAVNEGFVPLMDALERAHRKGYMPDAITDHYEGFDYRNPVSDVWRPFSTAPQDGTHMLAYWPRHPLVEDEDSDDGERMDTTVDLGGLIAVTCRNGNGWIEPDYLDASGAWFGDDFCYAPEPTHWQPLPRPPSAGAADASQAREQDQQTAQAAGDKA